jgi:hypothetical protein
VDLMVATEFNTFAIPGITPFIKGHVIEVSVQHLWAENKG